ncbi:MAG TPA: nuclear transport factor 2 family protein [Candidatus Krumholzibacteria bacterium]|nr:nuclear transport factor 2 family protein [Candidatus Krumholzibacteria bacterium]
MKSWVLAVLVTAVAASTVVPVHAGPKEELVAAVVQREAERQRAMIEVDLAALDDLFAADATYIHSNGLAQTKAGVVAMLEKKELRYVSFDMKEATYRVYGETIVCTGTQSIQLTSSGRPFTSNSRYTIVYAVIDGKPRVVAYQSTLLPEIVKQETTQGE